MDEKDKDKDLKEKDKIELNKKTDLLKLSISQIMNTKLYNFKGPYFEQLYNEALNTEVNQGKILNKFGEKNNKNTKKIESVQFEVKFITEARQFC